MINGVLWVAAGGFFGAALRHLISVWTNKKVNSTVPRATLYINLSGAFLLGLGQGENWSHPFDLMFETGFLGAFTTFSTLNFECIQLIKKKEWRLFILYISATYGIGIAAAFLGVIIGNQLKG